MNESVETAKRVVVDGRWDGHVIPGRIEELRRQVTVRDGAKVTGGVFGHSVRIEGPCEIARAAYATGDLELLPHGDIRLHSGAGARELLLVAEGEGRVIVDGDLVGRSVRLRNSVVRGGVHGSEVRLFDSLVLGPVIADRLIQLRDATVLTARGAEVVFEEGCGLILPFASASRSLAVKAPVHLEVVPEADATLDACDVVSRNGHHYLTCGRRLTDLSRIRGQLRNLERFMLHVTMGDALKSSPQWTQFEPEALPPVFARLLPEAFDQPP